MAKVFPAYGATARLRAVANREFNYVVNHDITTLQVK
jgi:hypothetical protein